MSEELLTLKDIGEKYPWIGKKGIEIVKGEIMKWITQNPKREWMGDFLAEDEN